MIELGSLTNNEFNDPHTHDHASVYALFGAAPSTHLSFYDESDILQALNTALSRSLCI
jgi:hypothetical protein